MSRGEAIAILSGVAVTVAFVLWLIAGNLLARRRVPERIWTMADFAARQDEINRLWEARRRQVEDAHRVAFGYVTEPVAAVNRPASWPWVGAPIEFCWPVSGALPFDWARDLHTPDWSRRRV